MLNRYPLWKNALILFIVALGVLYALPNIYPQDPVIQVASQTSGESVDESAVERAKDALQQEGIAYKAVERQGNAVIFRLPDASDQLPSKRAVEEALGMDYVVALNRLTTMPSWLASFGASPLNWAWTWRAACTFCWKWIPQQL